MDMQDVLEINHPVQVSFDQSKGPALEGSVSTVSGKNIEISFDNPGAAQLQSLEKDASVTVTWDAGGEHYSYPCHMVGHDNKTLKVELSGKERRDFQRIESFLLMRYEVIKPGKEEFAKFAVLNEPIGVDNQLREIEADFSGDADSERFVLLLKHVYKMHTELNEKLDSILKAVSGESIETAGKSDCPVINISGSGFTFWDDAELKEEDVISVVFEFSKLAFSTIRCLAKVIRCGAPKRREGDRNLPKYEYAVGFKLIRESDRERIIRYVFKRQREILRSRRS